MRTASIISAFLALACLGLIGLNLYDFWYRPELPWREGNLRSVLTTCMFGALVFAAASMAFFKLSKASN
jgi:hypothetical protein